LADLKPIFSIIPDIPAKPGPSNHPNKFCAPWAAMVSPTTTLRIKMPTLT
jgi:hypothetical protein